MANGTDSVGEATDKWLPYIAELAVEAVDAVDAEAVGREVAAAHASCGGGEGAVAPPICKHKAALAMKSVGRTWPM